MSGGDRCGILEELFAFSFLPFLSSLIHSCIPASLLSFLPFFFFSPNRQRLVPLMDYKSRLAQNPRTQAPWNEILSHSLLCLLDLLFFSPFRL